MIPANIRKKMATFNNATNLNFMDVTCKEYLNYNFPNGQSLKINSPIYMCILDTGVNLVWDESGMSYKIKPSIGWWKSWETRKGCAHFVNTDVVLQVSPEASNINKSVEQLNS